MNDSLEVEDDGEGLAKRKGRHREMGSERRVEQNRRPMDKNPIMRPYLAGRASKGSQKSTLIKSRGGKSGRACAEGGRSYLGRSPVCPSVRP